MTTVEIDIMMNQFVMTTVEIDIMMTVRDDHENRYNDEPVHDDHRRNRYNEPVHDDHRIDIMMNQFMMTTVEIDI